MRTEILSACELHIALVVTPLGVSLYKRIIHYD